MNFFKTAFETANTYVEKAKDFHNEWTKDDRLKKNLMGCTYS